MTQLYLTTYRFIDSCFLFVIKYWVMRKTDANIFYYTISFLKIIKQFLLFKLYDVYTLTCGCQLQAWSHREYVASVIIARNCSNIVCSTHLYWTNFEKFSILLFERMSYCIHRILRYRTELWNHCTSKLVLTDRRIYSVHISGVPPFHINYRNRLR